MLAERLEEIEERLGVIDRRLKENDFLTDKEREDEAIMHETMAYTHDGQ
jgi:hypothetical protein